MSVVAVSWTVSATLPAVDVIRGAAVARYSRATPTWNAPKFAGVVPAVSASTVSTEPVPAFMSNDVLFTM